MKAKECVKYAKIIENLRNILSKNAGIQGKF